MYMATTFFFATAFSEKHIVVKMGRGAGAGGIPSGNSTVGY